MDEIRSWWEVPSIAHFCSLFRTAFELTDFDIEDLEEALLETEKDEGSAFLLDLVCRLLNGCYARKDISVANYDLYVKDIIKFKWGTTESPIKEKSEFKELTLREKVEFIYAVCEYRLDTEDVSDVIKGFDGDSMRVEPLGRDKDGALYWYFYGSRLYMEDPEPKKTLSKEEKKALEQERKNEAKKKKEEEKRQKKQMKKLEAAKKSGKKKQTSNTKVKDSNARRSGRLKNKKVILEESDSSDTSDSSDEEEELDDSSTEEEEVVVKKTPARGRGKGKQTPAKSTGKKTNSKTPAKKETPKPTRTSSRKSKTSKKMEESLASQPERNTRRSNRKKSEPPPTPSAYDSDTEDNNDSDVDSGHESAGSEKSEVSKISQKSNVPGPRTSRRPTANVELKRDLSTTNHDDDDDDEHDDGDDDNEIAFTDEKSNLEDESNKSNEDNCNNIEDISTSIEGPETVTDGADIKCDEADVVDGENSCKKALFNAETQENQDINEQTAADNCNNSNVNNTSANMDTETANSVDESSDIVLNGNKEPQDAANDTAEGNDEQPGQNEVKTEDIEVPVNNDQKDTGDNMSEENKGIDKDCTEASVASESVPKDQETKSDSEQSNEKMDVDQEGNASKNSKDEVVKDECETESLNVNEDDKTEGVNSCDSENIGKAEESDNDMKDSIEDAKVKDETKPQIKTENEPMDVGESFTGRYSTRGLRKRIKAETEEVKKEENAADEVKTVKKELKLTLDGPAVEPTPSKSSTRWHLVCESLDDWVNLAEWFKDSTVKCEKSLSKEIRENFLPVLPEIIEAREKEKIRKLMQEQELRRSNRITLKMREKMEQEKILAEAMAEEEKARIQAEEEKKLKEEQLKLEEENRQREERRRAREERAQRLYIREEKARLLAEGKEIPPELIYSGSQKYKDKDDSDSDDSRCDLKDEEDFAALMKVISAMKYHKDCWPFLEPVTEEQAPDYKDIIKRPMDLSKIEEKVGKREYRSRQHFLSDFRLMFNNCKRYNGQDSHFSECARSMEGMLKKYIKRFVTDEPTDKYYVDEDFMVAGGKGRLGVGEKRYRPKRAASSRAIETVHKALNSSDEESSSDDSDERNSSKRRRMSNKSSPFKVQSHHDLLLEELKRQREKKLAASALQNHQVITRGPERIRVPNPQGGVMIIPKSEMNSSGVLRMAATREIKRKVNPQFVNKSQVVHKLGVSGKKDLGLNIIDQTTPGSNQPKTIRIVASTGSGHGSVKQTAENVKVSSDGFLIIGGKNSGIKVTENTKIVIQPPTAQPPSTSTSGAPTPPTQSPATSGGNRPDLSQLVGSSTVTFPKIKTGSTDSSVKPNSPAVTGQQMSLTGLLRQAATTQILSAHDQSRLQALIKHHSEGSLTPEKAKAVEVAKKILQMNLQKRKLLQQKSDTTDEENSPKVAKLGSPGMSSLIEQKLRDPTVSIDSQLGNVSKNVISNVNIASDILDTYYSVMNEAKNRTSGESGVSAAAVSKPVVTVANIPTAQTSVSNSVSTPQSSQLTIPRTVHSAPSQSSPSIRSPTPGGLRSPPVQGSISDVTRLIMNLINKNDTSGGGGGGAGGSSSIFNLTRPVVTTVHSVVTQSVANTTRNISQDSTASVSERLHSGNVVTDSLHGITSSSSVSDLLRSANMQNVAAQKTTNNDVGPIEALLTSNTAIKSNSVNVSKSSIVETLTSDLAVVQSVNVNQSIGNSTSVPTVGNIPNSLLIKEQNPTTSPEKSERVNLFDSFETNNFSGTQTVNSNDLNVKPDEKAIRLKLRADKMSMPSSSTVNFGSPLKTTSVLEALKCKLHTLKPDMQEASSTGPTFDGPDNSTITMETREPESDRNPTSVT
ncbi:cat eye syndrome chromosome region [Mactra antiquata]